MVITLPSQTLFSIPRKTMSSPNLPPPRRLLKTERRRPIRRRQSLSTKFSQFNHQQNQQLPQVVIPMHLVVHSAVVVVDSEEVEVEEEEVRELPYVRELLDVRPSTKKERLLISPMILLFPL